MTDNIFAGKKTIFTKLLSLGRIHDAINLLRNLSEQKMMWEITDDINKAEDSYRYMIHYALDGSDDPHRKDIYESIIDNLYTLMEKLEYRVLLQTDGTTFYNIARQLGSLTVSDAVSRYTELSSRGDAFSMALDNCAKGDSSLLDIEAAESTLFERVWTAYPLSKDDAGALSTLIESKSVPEHIRELMVSAIMLGNLQFFDDRRMEILADIYSGDGESRLSAIALTGIILSLYVNRNRRMSRHITGRIKMLKDCPTWASDIKTIFLELIRTHDTERIIRKMKDEIVPEMLKMKPEIDKKIEERKIDKIDKTDFNEMEENPEWEELLEKSGLAEKMRELTEIQEEGGDVLMATFAHLKSFPFFYRVANWFMPFHSDHSVVAQIGEGSDVIAEMIAGSGFICDSDKYSFILALGSVPNEQRNLMLSQFKAQNISAAELQNVSMFPESDRRRNIINKYIQNLYRFFALFRRKDDFNNPFAGEINLTEIPLLDGDFKGDHTLLLVAEFYFKHKYYREALDIFRIIENNDIPSAQLFQKMGYCMQKLDNLDGSLKYYEQAELLDASSSWTIKRMASLYLRKKDWRNALAYYQRLDAMVPDDLGITFHIGDCMLELGMYESAVKSYYKADYLSNGAVKARRRLAWALLLARDRQHAGKIFDEILESSDAKAIDFLNAGHYNFAEGNFVKAVDDYSVFVRMSDNNITNFINAMRADTSALNTMGVNPDMIPLVMDAVSYRVSPAK